MLALNGIIAPSVIRSGDSGFPLVGENAEAAAGALATPNGGLVFVTGTENIESIGFEGLAEGTVVTLLFEGILTVADSSSIRLAGDFVTSSSDTLTLVLRSETWYEVSRSVN